MKKVLISCILFFITLIFVLNVDKKEVKAWEDNKMPVVISCVKHDVVHYGAKCEGSGNGCQPNECKQEQE